MKTIYNRLKPDILASINSDEQKYPYTTKALKIKLKSSNDWSQLSVGDVQSIITHSHVRLIDVDQADLMWGDKFLLNEWICWSKIYKYVRKLSSNDSLYNYICYISYPSKKLEIIWVKD